MGAILSIMLFTMTVGYAAQKFSVVFEQSNAVIMAAKHDSFYTSDDRFGAEQGLNIAVGLFKYSADAFGSKG